jgi:hypothetical protein
MRSFIICTFFHQNKMLFGDKMKEDEVGDKFITNGREVCKIVVGKSDWIRSLKRQRRRWNPK